MPCKLSLPFNAINHQMDLIKQNHYPQLSAIIVDLIYFLISDHEMDLVQPRLVGDCEHTHKHLSESPTNGSVSLQYRHV